MRGKLTEPGGEDNEGTEWEARYRRGDHPWDHGRAVPAVKEALEFFGSPRKILVPGCGFGHDAAALARGGHSVEGWDLSPTAVEEASRLHSPDSVRFICGDLLEGPLVPRSFDAIFEHTFFCAIGPGLWSKACERYASLLRPGGLLFAVLFTNLVEENPPPWGIEESKVRELFSDSFEVLEVRQPREFFPRREGEETVWMMRRR